MRESYVNAIQAALGQTEQELERRVIAFDPVTETFDLMYEAAITDEIVVTREMPSCWGDWDKYPPPESEVDSIANGIADAYFEQDMDTAHREIAETAEMRKP